ncbi:hypothetical protein Bhyg_05863 [Pseudolycoriella hygida]|uniref:Uncharacterized protein n=1 Tax=Pseudolycoriella hygida TaxID=35572 RepID=A0A9Q0S2A5_9DIPT|nr:hypothetical protein Bhyg_05863 [Pseudolycoriella hygida]
MVEIPMLELRHERANIAWPLMISLELKTVKDDTADRDASWSSFDLSPFSVDPNNQQPLCLTFTSLRVTSFTSLAIAMSFSKFSSRLMTGWINLI